MIENLSNGSGWASQLSFSFLRDLNIYYLLFPSMRFSISYCIHFCCIKHSICFNNVGIEESSCSFLIDFFFYKIFRKMF